MWNYAQNNMMVNAPNYNVTSNAYYSQPQYAAPNYNFTNIFNNMFGYSQQQTAMQQPVFQGQMFGTPAQQPMTGGLEQMIGAFMQTLLMGLLMKKLQSALMPQHLEQTEITTEAKAWGDPHFNVTNDKGETLMTDHKGKDNHTYNILDARGSDGLLIDAKYVHYNEASPQVMGTMRVKAGNEELIFDRNGTATLNGKDIEKGKTYTTGNGTRIKYLEDGNIDLISREDDATIHLTKQDGVCLNVSVEDGSKLGNGHRKLGGVLGTLLNHRNDLAKLDGSAKVNDIDGDGKSDDLNGNSFIEDNEWAKLGYNFDVTDRRAIA